MKIACCFSYLFCLNLCYDKDLIESPDGIFEIIMAYTYDNIELTGALVDHLYIDMRMCKC